MPTRLPELSGTDFAEGLRRGVDGPLARPVEEALHRHYRELRRWAMRLSLVGPSAASDLLSRHYAESLAALPLLLGSDRVLVDVGSGAGFPGLVLAAARPDLRVTLIEARQKKCAFLRTAVRRCGLSCRCLNARVAAGMPLALAGTIDVVTCRGVRIEPALLRPFLSRGARFLLWLGPETPPLPEPLVVVGERPLAQGRRIVEAAEPPAS